MKDTSRQKNSSGTLVTVDLAEIRTSEEAKTFSGRERGKFVRRKFNLAKHDSDDCSVTVVIPADTYSMDSGFFLSMFGDSVRALGKEEFLKKYTFKCEEHFREDIMRNVDRALKTSSVLPPARS
jgi:hypothetical protein